MEDTIMGLKDIGETLPPGFRFNPSDEELICHYLYKKIANKEVLRGSLMEVDLHTCEPWQLPETAKLNASEWYFFSFRDRKYATGYRTNRATACGYWKATGKDRIVYDPVTCEVVGMRKTLVFYLNRAPNGYKTDWIMHEFRLESPHTYPKEDWVLCRVFYKCKPGEDTNTTSSSIDVPSTCQNKLTTVVPFSSPPNNYLANNNTHTASPMQSSNTFHKHNINIPSYEYQPHVTINSLVHHFGQEPNNNLADIVPIPVGEVAHSGDIESEDSFLRFVWELNEDDNNLMDIVNSTLEAQQGLEVDDDMMLLFP